MSPKTAYLALYNSCQCGAWSAILICALSALLASSPPEAGAVYIACGRAVSMAQAATFLETLHALFGLVNSGADANVLQFAGRGHAWLLVTLYPALQTHRAADVLVLSWALSDVTRYGWAARQSFPFLTYLRYTLFLVLYPLGAGAEWVLLYVARARSLTSGRLGLPNALNFACDYSAFLVLVLGCYPFLFSSMYSHMLRQRRRKLGPQKLD